MATTDKHHPDYLLWIEVLAVLTSLRTVWFDELGEMFGLERDRQASILTSVVLCCLTEAGIHIIETSVPTPAGGRERRGICLAPGWQTRRKADRIVEAYQKRLMRKRMA